MDGDAFLDAVRPWLAPTEQPLRAHLGLALRQAIDSGQLAQGVRLPPERAMAGVLNVSRPTVSAVIDDLRAAGLVRSRQGSGTWVSGGTVADGPAVPFVELVQTTGSIDLASATAPDASLLPPIRVETADLLGAEPANGLIPVGLRELRRQIAARASHSSPVETDDVIVTSGAHQALALVLASVSEPGATILLEDTTYGGLVDMVHANGCRVVAVPRDHDGPQPEQLAELIRTHRPVVVVLVASVHSPSGTVSSPARCAELADVLRDAPTTVVIDETYAELEFSPSGHQLVGALGDQAVRTGSLSKALWTGLRTGWIIAAPHQRQTLERRRWQQFDLGPAVPSQLFALGAMHDLDTTLQRRRAVLQQRADWVTERIGEQFPRWRPQPVDGGLAIWIDIGRDGDRFATEATAVGVSVLPGRACRADHAATSHIRICFDRPIDVLDDAFDRLARAGA